MLWRGNTGPVGSFYRQLFLGDHAGLPNEAVLEQIEILGTEVVPRLRAEMERIRPADVPSDPPTHANLLATGPEASIHKVKPARRVGALKMNKA
ncbi:hypothetical protein ACUY3S_08080 [Corynebacterium resistens]